MPSHFQTTYTLGTGPTTQALLRLQNSTLKGTLAQCYADLKARDMQIEAQDMHICLLEQLSDAKGQQIVRLTVENEMKNMQIGFRDKEIKRLAEKIGYIRRATD